MKSYNHLYEQYISEENYYLAIKNATRHKGGSKRKYRKAVYYKTHVKELKDQTLEYASHFKNERHKPIEIYDGIQRKRRTIIVPSMREQAVHHMVVNVMKPIWLKSMYEHSYGSLPNKGGHLAKKTIEKWIRRNDKNMKYCLKMDVSKFFDSIPHNILREKLAREIHDEKFLAVIYEIISVQDVGIPLGFYTSQWIANWYLTELDHYIKETLKAKYYVRYMDDMVVFGPNKKELHDIRKSIQVYLNTYLGLTLKDNWQVFLFDYVKKDGIHIGRDLDFMGFRFFRDKTILRKSIMLKATRKAKKVNKKYYKTIHECRQMLSYIGWVDCTDTYGMYKKLIKPYVSFRRLRKRISQHDTQKENLKCGENQKTATKPNLSQ